ncbi:unnamed protein product [Onchocerca flexuosa]|uniref:RNase H domain-containing protein n=1 Tax=Onchocerca flexuosa TaxID=387005 RepID=A0A183I572_9BILA|nr:unnamed protein product [Onchocerca flexuosa]
MVVQNIWQSGTNWDDKLKMQDRYQCEKLTEAFIDAPEITVPQWVPKENRDLHVFVDLRYGQSGLRMIYGKLILVPKKGANNKSAIIPRLELLALGTRIIEFLRQESEVKDAYLWTDSTCAIH